MHGRSAYVQNAQEDQLVDHLTVVGVKIRMLTDEWGRGIDAVNTAEGKKVIKPGNQEAMEK